MLSKAPSTSFVSASNVISSNSTSILDCSIQDLQLLLVICNQNPMWPVYFTSNRFSRTFPKVCNCFCPMDLAYMCVKPPNAFICVSGVAPPKHQVRLYVCHQMRLYVCHQNAFICVPPNAFICVSPNAFICVSKCVCRICNGARFARLPLLASLARFLTI